MAESNLIARMAEKFAIQPEEFKSVVKATCGLSKATDQQFLAFIITAHEHDLNPFTREIYAFTRPDGGIQPIVGVDGWIKLANRHPQYDGIEFDDQIDEQGKLYAITARIYRKDRQHSTVVTEYMVECRRSTDPWRQWPARMLRNKTAIQGFRMAFGFAGIMEPDEFERWQEVSATIVPAGPLDQIANMLPELKPERKLKSVAAKGDGPTPSPKAAPAVEPEVVAPVAASAPRPLTDEEIDSTEEMLAATGIKGRARKALLAKYGVTDVSDLTDQQAEKLGFEIGQMLGQVVDEGGAA